MTDSGKPTIGLKHDVNAQNIWLHERNSNPYYWRRDCCKNHDQDLIRRVVELPNKQTKSQQASCA